MSEQLADWINLCLKEDQRAQYQLYRYCYARIMTMARRYHPHPEDAAAQMNTAFFKILQHLKSWKKEQVPFDAWIKKIMINTLIDTYRKKSREKQLQPLEDLSTEDQLSSTDFWPSAALDAEYLIAMIHQLPPMTAHVFNLYAIDGYSHKEIGELLSMSEGTSRWHLNAARNQLQQLLETTSEPNKSPQYGKSS